jgi:hypothetical protein
MGGHPDHLHIRELAGNFPCSIDAIYKRHPNVDQQNVRFVCFNLLDGRPPVFGFGNDFHVFLKPDHQANIVAIDRAVVGNDDADLFDDFHSITPGPYGLGDAMQDQLLKD